MHGQPFGARPCVGRRIFLPERLWLVAWSFWEISLFNDLYDDIYEYDQRSEADITLDVPFVPTGERLVTRMLELSGIGENDLLYDLGCGDGRIVVAAARDFGARGVGIEIDPDRLEEARAHAKWNGVRHMLALIEDDLLRVNISKATVVTLYLLPSINLELRPRLLSELQPGTRIVSHAFDMEDWQADEIVTCQDTQLFLWIVPAPVAGTWQWRAADDRTYRVELEQKFQQVGGRAWVDDQPARLQSATLRGARLVLEIQAEGAASPQTLVSRYSDGQLLLDAGL